MKIALSTDWHLGIPERYPPQHREDLIRSITETIDLTLETDVDYFVNLGDIFHVPSGIRNYDLKFFRDCIDRLISSGVSVYCLVGNHDYHHETDLLSLFSNKGYSDRFNIVNSKNYPVFIEDQVVLIPFLLRKHSIDNYNTPYAFIHQEVKGAMEKHSESSYDRVFSEEDINKIGASTIYSGHIHIPIYFQSGMASVNYIGSVAPTSFAEEEVESRYVFFLDTESGDLSKKEIFQRKRKTIYDLETEIESGVVYRFKLPYFFLEDVPDIKRLVESKGGFVVDISIDPPEENEKPRTIGDKDQNSSSLLDNWLNYHSLDARESLFKKHKEIESKVG